MFDSNSNAEIIQDHHVKSTQQFQQTNNVDERFCKICYESEAVDDDWLHPCRCS